MKKLFLMLFVCMTLFACSNEEKGDFTNPTDNSKFALSLKIEQKTFTRGMQAPGTTATANIQSMIIEVYDALYNKIGFKELSSAEITAAKSNLDMDDASRIMIPNIDSRAAYVKLWAFQENGIKSVPDLTTSINSHQTKFEEVPFYPVTGMSGNSTIDVNGFISINKNATPAPGPNNNGNKIWTVETELAPYFARFEIKPTPVTGGIVPKTVGTGNDTNIFPVGTTIDITGIYMNNIYDLSTGPVVLNKGNHAAMGSGDWEVGHPYAPARAWSNMYNASSEHATTTALDFAANADCYTLFPQSGSPHVIVRVFVKLPEGSVMANSLGYSQFYGFITIKDFRISVDELLSAKGVLASKIYKVALDLTAKPSDVTPDPESANADLYAKVSIVDWTEVDLTPEL